MEMFSCRVLGTAPGKPVLGKFHSSVYVGINNKKVLIDCGEGTCQQLLKYGLDKEFLDLIIISHFHPDHFSGIFMVLQMLYLQKRVKPLVVYLPERENDFKETLGMMYLFPSRFTYNLILRDIDSLHYHLPYFTPLKNNHLESYNSFLINNKLENEKKSWSVLIKGSKHTLLYTSDFDGNLSASVKKIDYLIVDAFHPTVSEIMSLAKETRCQVYLTHGLSEEMSLTLKNNSFDNITVIDDGFVFEIE